MPALGIEVASFFMSVRVIPLLGGIVSRTNKKDIMESPTFRERQKNKLLEVIFIRIDK
jgi:hypothetical protein